MSIFWFLETGGLWKDLWGTCSCDWKYEACNSTCWVIFQEDEKINFVFHMNKKLLTCVALFGQESSENVVAVALVILREHHCWNDV